VVSTIGGQENLVSICSIDIDENSKYILYQGEIILGSEKEIFSVNLDGEQKKIFTLSKEIEKFDVESNQYIDILDKENNQVTSIDNEGNTIFTDKINGDLILYKSLNSNMFVSVYKYNDKHYIKIQDVEKNTINNVEINEKITHIQPFEDKIIISSIKADKTLYSELNVYNSYGSLENSCEFEDIIMDLGYINGNVYAVFEDKILLLNDELREESEVKINGIDLIKKKGEGIFITDNKNNIIYMQGDLKKTIKNISDVEKIEIIGEKYITYSDFEIYNENNKEIAKFDEKIIDVFAINDDIIAINVGNSINLYKIE
jgi:hypothetical protein